MTAMDAENETWKPKPFKWGEFFAGFFVSIAFNAVTIGVFVLLFGNNDEFVNWLIPFILGMLLINSIIPVTLPKEIRSFSRGWTVTLVLFALPLVVVGVCLGFD
ncbi:MAG: hypothetical protein GY765_30845 [bacterium]|nr:hypothetical protein [bacterium]